MTGRELLQFLSALDEAELDTEVWLDTVKWLGPCKIAFVDVYDDQVGITLQT